MNRLILKSFQSPGDIVMLSAAVRDLHKAYPGRFQTDVRTSADAIWENNPYLTRLEERESGVRSLDMHYPLIHQSNQRPYHFVHGYAQFLEQQLDLRIPVTAFRGDIHLSNEEKRQPTSDIAADLPDRYWILIAGGKYDFTAKWWNPDRYQAVVDHFQERITFVQCGESGHWHPKLRGVIDLIGKTSLRDLIRLTYHADGVVCGVTLAMHLAAAVPTRPGKPAIRPCVVVGGGREPAHWEAYPNHQFISTTGALPCCTQGGCWKSRCQLVGDGDLKDTHDICERPVSVSDALRIPQCMDLISAEDVIRRIEIYYQGGSLQFAPQESEPRLHPVTAESAAVTPAVGDPTSPQPARKPGSAATEPTNGNGNARFHQPRKKISVAFHHGLGDCAYFAHMIPLYTKRGYDVEVECTPDKAILFQAAGATTITSGATTPHPWGYPASGTHEGQGKFWQGSKMGNNLSLAPLPSIGDRSELWDDYCQTRIDISNLLSAESKSAAARCLASLPRPIVLLHTKGNTGQQRKSLPDETAAEFYKRFIDECDGTLILLDWDNRVPRLASHRVRHLEDLGGCSTEKMLALMDQADLIIGVDSGPLHASRFTRTPCIGIWMPGHYPTTYTLPRAEQLNIVLADHTLQWNRFKRIPWNIVEHPGNAFRAEVLASYCRQMLEAPRYLDETNRAADVQLRQFVQEWCRGERGNSLSGYSDRNRSFDVIFRQATKRFQNPAIVETGVIRSEEDWGGAGFFTYLAGAYVHRRGGRLDAVDITPGNCQFARTWTSVFGPSVEIHQDDSVRFLKQFRQPIDVLYLDSLDTTEPGHAEHGLREVEAALPRLHDRSIVVFDDTPWNGGAWVGKGAMAVPSLLRQGWKVLYAGYQAVLAKENS